MTFNVSNESKIQLINQRIEALNLEGYQHELNLKSAEALGNTELAEQSEASIAVIKSAIEIHEVELKALTK